MMRLKIRTSTGSRGAMRNALSLGACAASACAIGLSTASVASAQSTTTPWNVYPFAIEPGSPNLTYPTSEGQFPNFGSDSWYIDEFLTGVTTGRHYAIHVIFNKNHLLVPPSTTTGQGLVRADFYEFSIFDLDQGTYGTFTSFDFPLVNAVTPPKLSAAVGYLGLSFNSEAGTVSWVDPSDSSGNLVPFSSNLVLAGTDQYGVSMNLSGQLNPSRAPYATGGDVEKGVIECFGQSGTYEYGEAGTNFKGRLAWGNVNEDVVGTVGHYDRQEFPQYAGVDEGPTGQDISHIWASAQLDDGTDLSIWFQYARTNHNQPLPYQGLTASDPGTGVTQTEAAEDTKIQINSYVRYPFNSLPAEPIPPASMAMWMPDSVTITSPSMGMNLTETAIVSNPAHTLPVPYESGPVEWNGTYKGKKVHAVGFLERTLGYYRDFELVQALLDSAKTLPDTAFDNTSTSRSLLIQALTTVQTSVSNGADLIASVQATQTVTPIINQIQGPSGTYMRSLYKDFLATL